MELKHRSSQFYGASKGGSASKGSAKLKCSDCGVVAASQADAQKHALSTGHTSFEEVK